jgi:hypothetical protein
MLQIGLGVLAGFIAWLVLWIGSEKVVALIFPASFGVQQRAFQAALTEGAPFAPDNQFLLSHVVLVAPVSALAGIVAALVSGEHASTPLFLGVVLLALGVMKAVMSWRLVPLWYHLAFTALLLPMAIIGGRCI